MLNMSVVLLRRALIAALLMSTWAGGGWAAVTLGRSSAEGGAVTPHPEDARNYQYIPLRYDHFSDEATESDTPESEAGTWAAEVAPQRPKLAPSELILTVARTALDVVRAINKKRAAASAPASTSAAETTASGPGAGGATHLKVRQDSPRGYGHADDYYDDHHETTTTAKPAKPRYTDPWAGYYDFIINEGSFKFWSIFQLFTAGLLLYACLSAIYYAKFNPVIPDYDREYDDYFLERSSGGAAGRAARSLHPDLLPSGLRWMGPQTFQFIMDAISRNYGTSQ